MDHIFIKHIIDVEADVVQNRSRDKRLLIKNKTILSLAHISQSDNDNKIGGNLGLLTISNVVEVEVEDGITNIGNGNCRPQKFRNDALLDKSLGWTIKQETIYRISNR